MMVARIEEGIGILYDSSSNELVSLVSDMMKEKPKFTTNYGSRVIIIGNEWDDALEKKSQGLRVKYENSDMEKIRGDVQGLFNNNGENFYGGALFSLDYNIYDVFFKALDKILPDGKKILIGLEKDDEQFINLSKLPTLENLQITYT